MSTSPAIIHQGLLRPKGQFRANHPLLHLVVIRDVVVATAAANALPSQDTNPKICSSRPAASSRAVGALVGWLASSTLHEFELNKLPHARPNDTRPARRSHWASGRQHPPADRSLPPRVRVPLLYSIGISLGMEQNNEASVANKHSSFVYPKFQ